MIDRHARAGLQYRKPWQDCLWGTAEGLKSLKWEIPDNPQIEWPRNEPKVLYKVAGCVLCKQCFVIGLSSSLSCMPFSCLSLGQCWTTTSPNDSIITSIFTLDQQVPSTPTFMNFSIFIPIPIIRLSSLPVMVRRAMNRLMKLSTLHPKMALSKVPPPSPSLPCR
jgi:hypothetical protein